MRIQSNLSKKINKIGFDYGDKIISKQSCPNHKEFDFVLSLFLLFKGLNIKIKKMQLVSILKKIRPTTQYSS